MAQYTHPHIKKEEFSRADFHARFGEPKPTSPDFARSVEAGPVYAPGGRPIRKPE